MFHVDHTAQTHSFTHWLWFEGKKERKTIELVCYYLLTRWSIMIDVIERVEWIETVRKSEKERENNKNNTTFLYLYNGKNTFTKLMRSAHFTHFVWHVWWCTVYKWANVKTFLTLYVYVCMYICVHFSLPLSHSHTLTHSLPIWLWPFNIWFVSCAYLSCSTSDKTICPMWNFCATTQWTIESK